LTHKALHLLTCQILSINNNDYLPIRLTTRNTASLYRFTHASYDLPFTS
jgi:hypothetical protein